MWHHLLNINLTDLFCQRHDFIILSIVSKHVIGQTVSGSFPGSPLVIGSQMLLYFQTLPHAANWSPSK